MTLLNDQISSAALTWSATPGSECYGFSTSPETYSVKIIGLEEKTASSNGFKRGIPTQYYEVGNRLIADNGSRTTNAVPELKVRVLDGNPKDVSFEISSEYAISSLKPLSLESKNSRLGKINFSQKFQHTEEESTDHFFSILARDSCDTNGTIRETGKVMISGEHSNNTGEPFSSDSVNSNIETPTEVTELEVLAKEHEEKSNSQLPSSSNTKTSSSKTGISVVDKAKYKMMRELMALGAVDLGTINDGSERSEMSGICDKAECRLGCVCHTITGTKSVVTHCGKVDCMIDGCNCKGESYINGDETLSNRAEDAHLFAICQTRAHHGMATKEYNSVAKFVRTPDGSCRTIERDKRERRVPIRYQDDIEIERSESLRQKQENEKRRQEIKPRQASTKHKDQKTFTPVSDLKIDDLQRQRQDLVEKKLIKSSTVLLPMGRISQSSKIGRRIEFFPHRSNIKSAKETFESESIPRESSPKQSGEKEDMKDPIVSPSEAKKPRIEEPFQDSEAQCRRTLEYSWVRSTGLKYPPRWWTRRINPDESHFDPFSKIGIFNDPRCKINLQKYPLGSSLFIRWDIFADCVTSHTFSVTGNLSNGSVELFINKEEGISLLQLLSKFENIPGHLRKLRKGRLSGDSHTQWAVIKSVDTGWKWTEILMAPLDKLSQCSTSKDQSNAKANPDIVEIKSDEENDEKIETDELIIVEEESKNTLRKNSFLLKIRIGLPASIKAPEKEQYLRRPHSATDSNELKRRRRSNFCVVPKVVEKVRASENVDVSKVPDAAPTLAETISLPKEYGPPFLDPPRLGHFKIVYGLHAFGSDDVKFERLTVGDKVYTLHVSRGRTQVHLGHGFDLVSENQVSVPDVEQELKSVLASNEDVSGEAPADGEGDGPPPNTSDGEKYEQVSKKKCTSLEIRRSVVMARMKTISEIRDKGSTLDAKTWKENLRARVFQLKSKNKATPTPGLASKSGKGGEDTGVPRRPSFSASTEKPSDRDDAKRFVSKEDLLTTV